jgi:hypothetical protein
MVRTRSQNSQNSQNSKDCVSNSTIITEGVVTRSNSKSKSKTCEHKQQHKHNVVQKVLKKKELPRVELTDRIKTRLQARQQARQQEHQTKQQTMRDVKDCTHKVTHIHKEIDVSKTQNNQEMTSVWKNFESIFKYIDDFMQFKKRVEGKAVYII